MESETRWFKAVEDIVPTFYKEQRNKNGETPSEVFRREHQDLIKEAQIWVKETANFAAIIGTLMVSIMFAAGITVPGGNNDQDGLPRFSKRGYFRLFIGCDLVSVYLASLSVVLFLDIHKSSLTENDFLSGFLAYKLTASFDFLFVSIVLMLICFFASIKLVDRQLTWPFIFMIFHAFVIPFVFMCGRQLLSLYRIQSLSPFKTDIQISSFKMFTILRQYICD
ncbi:hypothetical protein SLA2020_297380 [Shorea laevis]